ncbi:MAG: AMP-binding protein [Chloroflexi bacterium]|nr:AMP-binding protein [Chloroflexota bacterium]
MSKSKTTARLSRDNKDTLPKLLVRNCNHWGDTQVALRKKEQGVWKERSWQECCDRIKDIFAGLADLGLKNGDKVAILGDNDPDWFCCQLAIQTYGGIVVGVNPVRTAEQTSLIFEHAQPKFAFAQDQEQVDKLLGIRDSLPSLEKIIYWNDKGLKHYDDAGLINMSTLANKGNGYSQNSADNFERALSQGSGNDIAMFLCVWKSSDSVELLPLTHGILISSGETVLAANPIEDKHEYVCVMNPGWFFEQVLGFTVSLLTGRRLNFAESGETAEEDLREISPHTLAYPSQMWDQLSIAIQSNMAGGTGLKRMVFNRGVSNGFRETDALLKGNSVSPFVKSASLFWEHMVFRPLRDKHGLDRTKVAYAAGGIVAPETLRFFHAIGVNLKQIYASIQDGVMFNDPGESRIEQ